MNVIHISGLRKSYGQQEVLHGVDLSVAQGRLVGFLGPNGAGKTTTIRILMGLIGASSGQMRVLGGEVVKTGRHIRKDIGYLPGEVRFYRSMTGLATLNFYALARRIDCTKEIKRLADVFELDLAKRVGKYSSGMKQKLGLIQAMMHRPKLLILDEPTTGLDPLVRKSVFSELRRFVAGGQSILFSSHSLSEVEQLCDDVVILRAGHVIEHETIEILRKRALRRVSIAFPSAEAVPRDVPESLQLIRQHDNLVEATWSGIISELIQWLNQQAIKDVVIERPNLEDLFLAYYSQAGGPSNAKDVT